MIDAPRDQPEKRERERVIESESAALAFLSFSKRANYLPNDPGITRTDQWMALLLARVGYCNAAFTPSFPLFLAAAASCCFSLSLSLSLSRHPSRHPTTFSLLHTRVSHPLHPPSPPPRARTSILRDSPSTSTSIFPSLFALLFVLLFKCHLADD